MASPDARGAPPDPVSELMNTGARRLLVRAYKSPGVWVGTRLADPQPRHVAYFAREYGINVLGPDPVHGKIDARTRWGRGFMRAIYRQHLYWSEIGAAPGWRKQKRMVPRKTGAIQVEWGNRVRAAGVIPAGRPSAPAGSKTDARLTADLRRQRTTGRGVSQARRPGLALTLTVVAIS